MQSSAFNGALEVELNSLKTLTDDETKVVESLPRNVKDHWSSYAVGALYYALRDIKDFSNSSFLIEIDSNLPLGAGISSSAALSTGLLSMVYKLFDVTKSREIIAFEAMKIEHNFTGTKCGQMDQLAVLMPKENHLISVDFEHFNVDGVF